MVGPVAVATTCVAPTTSTTNEVVLDPQPVAAEIVIVYVPAGPGDVSETTPVDELIAAVPVNPAEALTVIG